MAPPKCELNPQQPVKTLIFDLIGTCLDWHSAVSPVIEKAFLLPEGGKLPFTVSGWRSRAFHDGVDNCYEGPGLPQEDVDETRRRALLDMMQYYECSMDEDAVEACVRAWHEQVGMFRFWTHLMVSTYYEQLIAEHLVTSMAGRGCSATIVAVQVRCVSYSGLPGRSISCSYMLTKNHQRRPGQRQNTPPA
jgi:hypothetical protein